MLQSPGRSRSVSQPIREGIATDFSLPSSNGPHQRTSFPRSQSSNSILKAPPKGRARSSSLVTVTEVGGDEPENVVDRVGMGTNENAAWVNAPGAWIIHPVMILIVKILVDAIPGMTQDVSWTVVNLGYMAVSFLMFHHVTGVPFESTLTGGAYDEYTLWEQIDAGAHYTPAKKWLTSVPIGLFLISTHYTKYDLVLFGLNFVALVLVLFPKLPIVRTHPSHVSFTSDESEVDYRERCVWDGWETMYGVAGGGGDTSNQYGPWAVYPTTGLCALPDIHPECNNDCFTSDN